MSVCSEHVFADVHHLERGPWAPASRRVRHICHMCGTAWLEGRHLRATTSKILARASLLPTTQLLPTPGSWCRVEQGQRREAILAR
eukprot:CAMPEP_0174693990 /NCGR_PEP_ID=MMETSP1094-20130205/631_1 /TAXON_ID=156173 /ORGANISM="Chrysochromulina brevifilum, Strain UTEX LB 985" /LENGTH=85 /DNA_ID=CAMNT_0015890079 /DNA_START=182 /DNA_END=440 /DNA_ORIENTATION=-